MTREEMNICVLIPTYDNGGTLVDVLERTRLALRSCSLETAIIVVDDGSNDGSDAILANYSNELKERQLIDSENATELVILRHSTNKGKGQALLTGFSKAAELGYTHCLTIDSDGQHYPEDIPQMVNAATENPNSIIVGSRNLNADGMPSGNSFANKFSNFWFMLQTARKLEDTQTGFRVYPLPQLCWKSLITSRYEAELELMVFAAWHGTDFASCPVRVYYPPEELRVTHFRPYADFARITVLNTILCIAAIIYGYPSMILRKIFRIGKTASSEPRRTGKD